MDLNRKTAFQVLMDVEKNGAYSNLSLNSFISRNNPDSPAFVRELVYGVLKNKYLLDWYIGQLVKTGLSKVKKPDLMLLRIGAYQLSFMNSVPEFAAVNETVNLEKRGKGTGRLYKRCLKVIYKKQEQPERAGQKQRHRTLLFCPVFCRAMDSGAMDKDIRRGKDGGNP